MKVESNWMRRGILDQPGCRWKCLLITVICITAGEVAARRSSVLESRSFAQRCGDAREEGSSLFSGLECLLFAEEK